MTLNELLKKQGILFGSEWGRLVLEDAQIVKLERFLSLFKEKNERINLSSIREERGIYLKHIYDSLAIFDTVNVIPAFAGMTPGKILDLGTGGGLPGIPLAIALPKAQFTLLDATGKKIMAVNEFIRDLGLVNARGIQGRAEELAHQKAYREQFDLVVSRAVADMAMLAEYALPFVHVGGYFLAYKGKDPQEELQRAENGIALLGGRVADCVHLDIPILGERSFVVIKKERQTPWDYPRAGGEIAKKIMTN